jgi:hypothetical protein
MLECDGKAAFGPTRLTRDYANSRILLAEHNSPWQEFLDLQRPAVDDLDSSHELIRHPLCFETIHPDTQHAS